MPPSTDPPAPRSAALEGFERMLAAGAERGVPIAFPRPALCADNAAMIAAVGRLRLARGERDPWTLNADPGWQI